MHEFGISLYPEHSDAQAIESIWNLLQNMVLLESLPVSYR